jgi:hypothetical protein
MFGGYSMTYINRNVKRWNANSFSPQQVAVEDPKRQMSGLGDLVDKFTTKTGIKKIVDKVTGGKGCGCNKRKDTLNRLVPFKKEDGNE